MPTTKKVASKKSVLKKQEVSLHRAKKVSTVKLIAKKTSPVVQKKPTSSGILKSTNKKMLQKLIGDKKNIKVIEAEDPEPNIKIGHK